MPPTDPASAVFDPTAAVPARIGVAYVAVGSMLGGGVIARQVRPRWAHGEDVPTAEQLLALADEDTYRDKHAGGMPAAA